MEKITVLYSPRIDDEEKRIIGDGFKQDVDFVKLEQKGVSAGASFDVQIILNLLYDDFLYNPYFVSFISIGIYDLIKKIFNRNRRKIMDNDTRPRYTQLTIRMKTKWIVVSNVNSENRITIIKTSASSGEFVKNEDEYSDDKLAEYIND